MNDLRKITFKQVSDDCVEIYSDDPKSATGAHKIGQIFSKGSYSGSDSIQVCGFDSVEGPWSCGAFNNSQDICLKWINLEEWFKKKDKSKYHLVTKKVLEKVE